MDPTNTSPGSIDSEPLEKGWRNALLGGIVASGLISSPMGPKTEGLPPIPKAQAPADPYHLGSLHPDLRIIAQLESSGGKYQKHAAHTGGDWMTAHGPIGLKPVVAHDIYSKDKLLQNKYPGLTSQKSFLDKFKVDPGFYNDVANKVWENHTDKLKDIAKQVYAWRWGRHAAINTKPANIQADKYVQAFLKLKGATEPAVGDIPKEHREVPQIPLEHRNSPTHLAPMHKSIDSMPANIVYISWAGEHLETQSQQYQAENDTPALKVLEAHIHSANRLLESLCLEHDGKFITALGVHDIGRMQIDIRYLQDLIRLKDTLEDDLNSPVTLGVGKSITEADQALFWCSLKTPGKVMLFTENVQKQVLDHLKALKLEGLGKSDPLNKAISEGRWGGPVWYPDAPAIPTTTPPAIPINDRMPQDILDIHPDRPNRSISYDYTDLLPLEVKNHNTRLSISERITPESGKIYQANIMWPRGTKSLEPYFMGLPNTNTLPHPAQYDPQGHEEELESIRNLFGHELGPRVLSGVYTALQQHHTKQIDRFKQAQPDLFRPKDRFELLDLDQPTPAGTKPLPHTPEPVAPYHRPIDMDKREASTKALAKFEAEEGQAQEARQHHRIIHWKHGAPQGHIAAYHGKDSGFLPIHHKAPKTAVEGVTNAASNRAHTKTPAKPSVAHNEANAAETDTTLSLPDQLKNELAGLAAKSKGNVVDPTAAKARIGKILNQLKGRSKEITKLKETEPAIYKAISDLLSGIIQLGKNINGDTPAPKDEAVAKSDPLSKAQKLGVPVESGTSPSITDQAQPRTNTPQFKQWFEGSQVKNPHGDPKTVYHGTVAPEPFSEFSMGQPRYTADEEDEGRPEYGSGHDPTAYLGSHFAQEKNVANMFAQGLYSREGNSGRVYPVHLSIKNPKIYDSEEQLQHELHSYPWNSEEIDSALMDHADRTGVDEQEMFDKYNQDLEFRREFNQDILHNLSRGDSSQYAQFGAMDLAQQHKEALMAQGYDGIKYANGQEGGTSWIAFHPHQIKSAIGNTGSYDPNDPNIHKDESSDTVELDKAGPMPKGTKVLGVKPVYPVGSVKDGKMVVQRTDQNGLPGKRKRVGLQEGAVSNHTDGTPQSSLRQNGK